MRFVNNGITILGVLKDWQKPIEEGSLRQVHRPCHQVDRLGTMCVERRTLRSLHLSSKRFTHTGSQSHSLGSSVGGPPEGIPLGRYWSSALPTELRNPHWFLVSDTSATFVIYPIINSQVNLQKSVKEGRLRQGHVTRSIAWC